MLTPCWPSAGPTGGAGVAVPPGTCRRIWAVNCFAIFPCFPGLKILGEIHLPVFQLDRHRPSEDGQLDPQGSLGLQHFLDLAFHASERTVLDLDPIPTAEA